MSEGEKPNDPMVLILAELKSLNRTMRLLASHLMDHEAPPRSAVDGMLPLMSDELPQRLAKPIMQRLREMEPGRREHLLGALRRAWEDS